MSHSAPSPVSGRPSREDIRAAVFQFAQVAMAYECALSKDDPEAIDRSLRSPTGLATWFERAVGELRSLRRRLANELALSWAGVFIEALRDVSADELGEPQLRELIVEKWELGYPTFELSPRQVDELMDCLVPGGSRRKEHGGPVESMKHTIAGWLGCSYRTLDEYVPRSRAESVEDSERSTPAGDGSPKRSYFDAPVFGVPTDPRVAACPQTFQYLSAAVLEWPRTNGARRELVNSYRRWINEGTEERAEQWLNERGIASSDEVLAGLLASPLIQSRPRKVQRPGRSGEGAQHFHAQPIVASWVTTNEPVDRRRAAEQRLRLWLEDHFATELDRRRFVREIHADCAALPAQAASVGVIEIQGGEPIVAVHPRFVPCEAGAILLYERFGKDMALPVVRVTSRLNVVEFANDDGARGEVGPLSLEEYELTVRRGTPNLPEFRDADQMRLCVEFWLTFGASPYKPTWPPNWV